MKPKIPTFKTDREAEHFIATADLSKYDMSGAKLVRFELQPKEKSISLRLSESLLDAIRKAAKAAKMPCQRYIRMTLEQAATAH